MNNLEFLDLDLDASFNSFLTVVILLKNSSSTHGMSTTLTEKRLQVHMLAFKGDIRAANRNDDTALLKGWS